MPRGENERKTSTMLTAAATVIVIAAMYLAKSILAPLALAILLSFLLAPAVSLFEHWKLSRVAAVLIVVALSFALLAGIGRVVWGQLADLAERLPEYQDNIRAKVESVRSGAGRLMGRAGGLFSAISGEPGPGPASRPAAAPQLPVPVRPVPVEVVQRPLSPLQLLESTVGTLLEPLAAAGLVIIFVIFMLVWREDLRDRLIRLISPDEANLNVTTQAMDDAAQRISRYLLMQLVVNLCYAVPISVGLFLIGVPNAFLWGLLSALFRFIPYVGPWLGAAGPIALSLAASQSWWTPALTVSLYIGVELVTYNVAEPLIYGASTGISSVAVLVAAVFWGWLWGIPGLLLATPLTVCLAVAGKYVPQLRFLSILLGDEPVLAPPMRIYQRLLAGDVEEAGDVLDESLDPDKGLVEAYDHLLLPALALAEADRHRGALDERRRKQVDEGMRQIVEELGERFAIPSTALADSPSDKPESGSKPNGGPEPVDALCLPASDDADDISAEMLAQALTLSSPECRCRHVPVAALASEMVESAVRHQARLVCICAIPPSAAAYARYLCKRVKSRLPETTLITGLWAAQGDLARIRQRLGCGETGQVARTLAEAVATVVPLIQTGKRSEERETTSDRR